MFVLRRRYNNIDTEIGWKMVKVAVLGASGGVGQPLSLLLKLNTMISELALYDIKLAEGVATDLSHINTNADCVGYSTDDIGQALKGAAVVVIPAGVPRRPGITRDDLFKLNAGIVKNLVSNVAKHCPNARLLIISNPVNSLIPVAVETLKRCGVFQAGNVMGVTTLDLVRAETFLAEYLNTHEAKEIGGIAGERTYDKSKMYKYVGVIGGHSGETIVPLVFNHMMTRTLEKTNKYDEFINRVQYGGDEVVKAKAKDGSGSATLSMALAGSKFVNEVLQSVHRRDEHRKRVNRTSDRKNVTISSTYVYLPGLSNGKEVQEKLKNLAGIRDASVRCEYFALPVVLEDGRVTRVDKSILDSISPKEKEMVKIAIQELEKNVNKGKDFVSGQTKL